MDSSLDSRDQLGADNTLAKTPRQQLSFVTKFKFSCLVYSRANHGDIESTAKKNLIGEAVKLGDGRASLQPTSWKEESQGNLKENGKRAE